MGKIKIDLSYPNIRDGISDELLRERAIEAIIESGKCTFASDVTQEENEEKWLQERKAGIGGSDIGAIMGVSQFSTARQIYLSKTNQDLTEGAVDSLATERMHFGHVLEDIVAQEFVKRNASELDIFRVITIDGTFASKQHPFMRANIDRLIIFKDGTLGILECKTTSEYNNDSWKNAELPETYRYQVLWYMYVFGIEEAHIACLVGGNKFYSYPVWYDNKLAEGLVAAGYHFWHNNVQLLIEPEPMANDTAYLDEKYADVEQGSELEILDEDNIEIFKKIAELKAAKKDIEAELAEYTNKAKDIIKTKEIAYTPDFKITWKPQSRRLISSKKLKEDRPDIWEEYAYDSTCRTFKMYAIGNLDD